MDSQPQDTNNIVCSQHTSKDTPPIHFSNQFAQFNLPFQSNYQFRPMPGSYQFGGQFSYQDLLNNPSIPIDVSQYNTTTTGRKRKSKAPQKSVNLQTTVNNKSWTKDEDVSLTKAWLYVSVDSDVGNSQKGAAMWNRIIEVWKDHMGTRTYNARITNPNSFGCRWQKIQGAVSKFHGIYERLDRHPLSGTNLESLKREAMRMYEDDNNGKAFKYEHCWEILKKNPKWCSLQLTKVNGTNKPKAPTKGILVDNPGEDSTVDGNSCEGIHHDGIVRPQGRKACKEKKRKVHDENGVVDALNKLQCTLEMQIKVDREELEIKKEREMREFEMREQILKRNLELKEEGQRLKMKDQQMKEEAQRLKRKDQELREKTQRRQEQDRIMNQDLTKLSPALREMYENYQAQILKEWENDGLFGSKILT